MQGVDDSSARLKELESRIAFLEHLLDKLNKVVTDQQDRLDAQAIELTRLREQMDTPADDMPVDERPPHY